jgi:hypothetical protein
MFSRDLFLILRGREGGREGGRERLGGREGGWEGGRERERDRERDRQTDRQRARAARERERARGDPGMWGPGAGCEIPSRYHRRTKSLRARLGCRLSGVVSGRLSRSGGSCLPAAPGVPLSVCPGRTDLGFPASAASAGVLSLAEPGPIEPGDPIVSQPCLGSTPYDSRQGPGTAAPCRERAGTELCASFAPIPHLI